MSVGWGLLGGLLPSRGPSLAGLMIKTAEIPLCVVPTRLLPNPFLGSEGATLLRARPTSFTILRLCKLLSLVVAKPT